jgi:hypothetical protein
MNSQSGTVTISLRHAGPNLGVVATISGGWRVGTANPSHSIDPIPSVRRLFRGDTSPSATVNRKGQQHIVRASPQDAAVAGDQVEHPIGERS